MTVANKFFLTREPASHQGKECFHFATHVNRTLKIDEGRELRDLLTDLLGDAPKPEVALAAKDKIIADMNAGIVVLKQQLAEATKGKKKE